MTSLTLEYIDHFTPQQQNTYSFQGHLDHSPRQMSYAVKQTLTNSKELKLPDHNEINNRKTKGKYPYI